MTDIATGFFLIAGGGVLLSWQGAPAGALPWGALAVVAACFGWAVDNNLTQRVSGSDPMQIAGIKGFVAGSVNVALAVMLGWRPEAFGSVLAALSLGFLGYGISLSLFVWVLRHLGTARTGAYFSVAPFFGAATALVILPERPDATLWIAASMRRLASGCTLRNGTRIVIATSGWPIATLIGTTNIINTSTTNPGKAVSRIPMNTSMSRCCMLIPTTPTSITDIGTSRRSIMFESMPESGPWPFGPLIMLAMALIVILPFWFIFSKAGYSKWLSLLMIFPLVNIILLYFIAFSKWPSLVNKSQ